MTGVLRTWLKFNAVGIIGVGVQLAALALLRTGFGMDYLVATFLAVETAVLHNFVWHERWTWVERTRQKADGVVGRLFRFHLANGLISIAGNLLLMWLFVSRLHLHYFIANLLAIGTCSIVNFLASDRLVFRSGF
ncbi:MAG TPA: GtrA family protein [Terriglobia bacterium]|nr:GtrA family protein [Terriglobia bacterium]